MDNPNVTNEKKGYRDVWWCWLSNEPSIVRFSHDLAGKEFPQCSVCFMELAEDLNKSYHTFVAHILKPTPGTK